MTPEVCPLCGELVPPRAKACPHCGADELTGWSDEAKLSGLGLPSEDFDYDRFVAEEWEGKRSPGRKLQWLWWLTALVLVVVLLWFFR